MYLLLNNSMIDDSLILTPFKVQKQGVRQRDVGVSRPVLRQGIPGCRIGSSPLSLNTETGSLTFLQGHRLFFVLMHPFRIFCFLFDFTAFQFIYVWQPQSSSGYQFSKICLAECPFYHSSLKSVLQSFYFPPELLSKPSRELACKNREFSHCFRERCYITTQQGHCSLFAFILVTLTDLLCITSTVAFSILILSTAVVTFFGRHQIGVK